MMKTLYIIPLDKKGKDPGLCKSKRPISLLNVAAKILENIVHVRLIQAFEPRLSQNQYAYRRDNGTKFHMTEMFEFLATEREKGHYVYLAAVDVEAAFDSVPRNKVLETLAEWNTDGHTLRYLRRWLTMRRFVFRLQSPSGVHFSTKRAITCGLPQRGVLSPFLWLVHFNSLKNDLEKRRKARNEGDASGESIRYCDPFLCG